MARQKNRAHREAFDRLVNEKLGDAGAVVTEDYKLFRYETDGSFDPDLYREVQTLANKMKIDRQFVPEEHVALLSRYMNDQGLNPTRGICHGTRSGAEQNWFREHLGNGADVIGTEISDTATQFPHTIQWDFHEVDPDWVGKMDFVYSNSWDHAHDPERAFTGWISCLKRGGMLLLDHGWNYQPDRVTAMDPFGISEAGLVAMLDRLGKGKGAVAEVLDGGDHKGLPIRTIVFREGQRPRRGRKIKSGGGPLPPASEDLAKLVAEWKGDARVAECREGRIAVYTCHFGDHEPFNPKAVGTGTGVDRVIFTDHALELDGTQILRMDTSGRDPKRLSRLPKLCPHLFFPDHEWVIYVDNNATLLRDPVDLIAEIEAAQGGEAEKTRYLFPHRARNSPYRELRLSMRLGKVGGGLGKKQLRYYRAQGLPREAGVHTNTVMIQRMGDPVTDRFNEAWFQHFLEFSPRDQVAMSYVRWRDGYSGRDLPWVCQDLIKWPVFGRRKREEHRKAEG